MRHFLPRYANKKIAILMYHSISSETEEKVHSYFRVSTHPKVFEKQIGLLHSCNYRAIRVNEIKAPRLDHQKVVAVTFDDAFDDFYTKAYALLDSFKMTATVFIPSDLVGTSDRLKKGKTHLSWVQIRELDKLGIEFGSHSMSHRVLKSLPRDQIFKELSESKKEIEDKLGHAITSFSYPYALPEEDPALMKFLIETLKNTGYTCAVGTGIGLHVPKTADTYSFMRRIPVNSSDDTTFFSAKLAGAYDWLSIPQGLTKKARRFLRLRNKSKSITSG